MSDFRTATLEPTALDPNKRVRYLTGLVLGVDELRQEQTYFIERDRLHQRSLHGYGTVVGLRVSVEDAGDVRGPEVRVDPGLAVDPHGQHICVDELQCAELNAWLEARREEILERVGSPPSALSAYVVLCYRECETDDVPLPGGPCRSRDDTMAASRLADGFSLELALDTPALPEPGEDAWPVDYTDRESRPPHGEEAAIRRFAALLASLEITDAGGPYLDEEELGTLVRSLAEGEEPGSPPLASPPEASPPDGSPPGAYRLHPADAPGLLDLAFRIWITEIRPTLLGRGRCPRAPSGDDCVLLAELRFEVVEESGLLRVRTNGSTPPVEVVEEERPLLHSTRLLQELLLHGSAPAFAGWGGGSGGSPLAPFSMGGPAEADLTRILALSWVHDEPSEAFVDVSLDEGGSRPGLVVAFGRAGPGDRRVLVDSGSLDEHTFQVFLREPDGRGFWYPRAVRPRAVLPVTPSLDGEGRIVAAAESLDTLAPAAAFVVDETTLEAIGNEEVDVAIRGDFVLDETGRAIDAEHLRGGPGTGDRPADGALGIQGGRFESWFVHILDRININTATQEELQLLPRIGPVLAEEIVETREDLGGFTAVEDLLEVDGIGDWLLGVLRPFVTV